jgi:hypothetical protein
LMERLNPDELLQALMLPLNWNVEKLILSMQPGGPPPGLPPPGQGMPLGGKQGQLTPQQAQSARQGAAMGGATNNPMARRPIGPAGGGGAPPPNQLMAGILSQMAGRR